MHWTTLFLLPLLQTATTQHTTRITTKFAPDCPSNSGPQVPGDFNLNEEFSVALNVRSGVCQGVPVPLPLGFFDEVDHISFEFEPLQTEEVHAHAPQATAQATSQIPGRPEIHTPNTPKLRHYGMSSSSRTELTSRESSSPNLEVCTVRLFERPGCSDYDKPLIQREFGAGAGIGGTSRCVQRTREYIALEEVYVKVDCVDGSRPGGRVHGNATIAGAHSNSTRPATGDGDMGKWQLRRLGLLGR